MKTEPGEKADVALPGMRPGHEHPRHSRFFLPGMVALVLASVVLSSSLERGSTVSAAQLTDQTIVAELGSYQRPYPEALREAVREARRHPDNLESVLNAAHACIDTGRTLGDARLVGLALGLLSPWLKAPRPKPEVMLLAAVALQYNHDFAQSIVWLNRILVAVPGNLEAMSVLADIDVVQGRLKDSAVRCQQIAASGRIDVGLICDLAARGLTPSAQRAFDRLEAMLPLNGVLAPQLRGYAAGLLAEMAAIRGWKDKARAYFTIALETQPTDLRLQMVYADFLLTENDPSGALAALEAAPATDGVMIRRAVAYRDLGDNDAIEPLRDALQRTFDVQHQLGLTVHAREEARFLLEIQNDPAAALERALVNFTTQRELEDAELVFAAAEAAGSPSAADPVREWMSAEGVDAPALIAHGDRPVAGQ